MFQEFLISAPERHRSSPGRVPSCLAPPHARVCPRSLGQRTQPLDPPCSRCPAVPCPGWPCREDVPRVPWQSRAVSGGAGRSTLEKWRVCAGQCPSSIRWGRGPGEGVSSRLVQLVQSLAVRTGEPNGPGTQVPARHSWMGCAPARDRAVPHPGARELGEFHAFVVSDLRELRGRAGESILLLRVQNPWGRRCWRGPWAEG